jgi:hypothetical protein
MIHGIIVTRKLLPDTLARVKANKFERIYFDKPQGSYYNLSQNKAYRLLLNA